MLSIVLPLFPAKKTKNIRIPKNYNDTSNSRYAINNNGYLEEIQNDRLSSQAN